MRAKHERFLCTWGVPQNIRLSLALVALVACDTSSRPRDESDASTGSSDTTACPIALQLDALEGDSIVQSVRCPDDLPTRAELELEPLPAGAVFDSSSSELRWTPALDQAGHHVIRVRANGGKGSGTIEIDVIDQITDVEKSVSA